MTSPLPRFPNVERVLTTLLEPLAGGTAHTGTETPGNLQEVLPFIRVRRTGGPATVVNDFARVTVDVFHSTYGGGERLAEQVRQFLLDTKPSHDGAVVDRVACDLGPVERPWAPGVRLFAAEYTLVSRRYLAA